MVVKARVLTFPERDRAPTFDLAVDMGRAAGRAQARCDYLEKSLREFHERLQRVEAQFDPRALLPVLALTPAQRKRMDAAARVVSKEGTNR